MQRRGRPRGQSRQKSGRVNLCYCHRLGPGLRFSTDHKQSNKQEQGVIFGLWYRVYFLNDSGRIDAAEVIPADSDEAAVVMAEHLYDATCDLYAGYEVWEQSRQIAVNKSPRAQNPPQSLADITEQMQDSLVEREIALRDSSAYLSQSRRLLERIDRLRHQIAERKAQPDPASDLKPPAVWATADDEGW
jgi:hypothetical protein